MSRIEVDAARLPLPLDEPRLPAISRVWADLAVRTDKEGWPAARTFRHSPNSGAASEAAAGPIFVRVLASLGRHRSPRDDVDGWWVSFHCGEFILG